MDIWDPFEEMRRFRKEMDRVFEEMWGKRKPIKALIREPLVDIEDKKSEIIVTTELPGIDKKDVKVKVEADRVEIRADRKEEKEEKKKDFYRKERSYRGFYKVFSLPAEVDPDKAKLKFENGLLKLQLLKVKQLKKKSKLLQLK